MTSRRENDRHDVPRCGARKRQGEGFCTQVAGWGTAHLRTGRCKLHGGNTRNQAVAAERVRVESEARRALVGLDVGPVGDPLAALMGLAGEALAFHDAAAGLVNGLDEIRYTSAAGTEQLRAEVGLYERATVRAVKILVLLIQLGVEERLVRVEESKAAALVVAIDAALSEIGISGPDALAAKRVVARHLRALSSEPAGEVAR